MGDRWSPFSSVRLLAAYTTKLEPASALQGRRVDTWFIAEGRLHRLDGSGAQHVVESPFVAEAVARSERSGEIAGWKHAARDDDDRGRLVPRSALWGTSGGAGFSAEHRFRHVVRGANDSVYYVVTLGRGTALFRYYPAEKREVRLFHGASMRCLGIAAEPGTERIALSAGNADGTASLEIVDGDGRRRGNVTGGDSIDGAPSFSESAPATVVFQSSGVARNAQTNQAAAIGPRRSCG